ncbi:hypothetical protein MASR2M39_28530 [Ignavibacteriales bacterium]
MYGNGVGTGMKLTVQEVRQTRMEAIPVPIVFYGVVGGSIVWRAAMLQTATAAVLASGTVTATGFV